MRDDRLYIKDIIPFSLDNDTIAWTEDLNVQEKVEVVRFLVPLGEWKKKGVKA